MLKNIYHIVSGRTDKDTRVCLATLVTTSGSVPQVAGSSALFSEEGLLVGTLGGGIMEGDAQKKAIEVIRSGKHLVYEFHLDANSADEEGALCGGKATILIDPAPCMHLDCFREMSAALEKGQPGLMITLVSDKVDTPIRRFWLESTHPDPADLPGELRVEWKAKLQDVPSKDNAEISSGERTEAQAEDRSEDRSGERSDQRTDQRTIAQSEVQLKQWQREWPEIEKAFASALKGEYISLTNEAGDLLFIEPIFPLPKLIIAGAGHIGKALAHQARLLDFEVTVIDDRPEFANSENIPDADHIIVKPIGEAISEIPKSKDTYIVLVTRGHKDDSEALKACIGHELPYIGMIGSRKKIRLLKEKFLLEGWSTREQFERVHAPIGIEIGSITIQEIALSIAAQLVQARADVRMHTWADVRMHTWADERVQGRSGAHVQERAAARMQGKPPDRKGKKREIIASVILAAGESRRMGKPKMLLPFENSTIIGTVVRNALNAVSDHVHVVLGANADAIQENIADLKVEKVLNKEYRNGMLSSVQAGIRSLPEATTAVMILLGDQPMISADIMDRMITQFKQSDKDILIASVEGKRGHPMIFSARYIPEVLAYGPGDTLRNLPEKYPGEVEELETGKQEILRDIDTPQDYENEIKTGNYD